MVAKTGVVMDLNKKKMWGVTISEVILFHSDSNSVISLKL